MPGHCARAGLRLASVTSTDATARTTASTEVEHDRNGVQPILVEHDDRRGEESCQGEHEVAQDEQGSEHDVHAREVWQLRRRTHRMTSQRGVDRARYHGASTDRGVEAPPRERLVA